MDHGYTLTLLSEQLGRPERLEQSIDNLIRSIHHFREVHYETVKKLLPEAVERKMAGTSGIEDAGTFLRKRMEIGSERIQSPLAEQHEFITPEVLEQGLLEDIKRRWIGSEHWCTQNIDEGSRRDTLYIRYLIDGIINRSEA